MVALTPQRTKCPRCAGFMVIDKQETYCLMCGRSPSPAPETPLPVLGSKRAKVEGVKTS